MNDITIDVRGLTLSINISELSESLTSEEKMALAEGLCWDDVMQEAIRRLAGQSQYSISEDYTRSWDFLADQIADQALNVRFGAFRRVCESLQNQHYEARMYWKLRHDNGHLFYDSDGRSVTVGNWFRTWCERNGFKDSNFLDRESGAWAANVVAEFEKLMRKELEK